MEKFMLIFHGGLYDDKLSPEEIQRRMGLWYEWIEKLSKSQQYLAGEPLKDAFLSIITVQKADKWTIKSEETNKTTILNSPTHQA